ncbi:uracil-DNA glycosylase family protein [Segetibacter aerophilus]|uniref:Uracil-DNA glycosylase-like domain-containing protein n=1 Tax=Segetibacter aerophilus TaxID=670293 RepID=A0A512BHX0_9BACT|nr:uracil-DNA glycosylase family protein [Segetibacter aerophilus]GEO11553.1 hypothetical protein SAE01_40490 [Segetibacter aerophilus]
MPMVLNNENLKIRELLACVLGIEPAEIESYYKSITVSFNQKLETSYSGFISVPKFKNVKFKNEATKENWENASLTGIDLPLFFQPSETSCKTVAVVGIDPLRKRKDFTSFHSGNVIIGTPYGFHSSYYRESRGRTKVYYDLIKHLVFKGYNTYVTDIFKIWMNDYHRSERDSFSMKNELLLAKECLENELEIVKPKIVVAFGEFAEKTCRNVLIGTTLEAKILPLPHPSGRNTRWNQILDKPRDCERKAAFLIQEVDRCLKSEPAS